MLSDSYRQLLTAYVDGELSSRQRRQVIRLLHRSAEARRLLEQLKADSLDLRNLPRPPLPEDFCGSILRLIAERSLSLSRKRTVDVRSAIPWTGPVASWAVAAAVLLAIGVASYFYFVASLEPGPRMELAQTHPEPPDATKQLEELRPPIPMNQDDIQRSPRKPRTPKIDRRVAVNPPKVVRERGDETKYEAVKKPRALSKDETALTDRFESFQLDRVQDMLPVVVKLSDLDRPAARTKLVAELQKDSAFRLELPCPSGLKAFERVQKAANSLHINLLIDKPAQERIKLKWRISYLLYIENLMPEELTEFVRQIEVEDRKRASGKAAQAQFDQLVLMRLNTGHRKELAAFLGVDPTAADRKESAPPGPEPLNPLAEATARQVEQSLAGQGSIPRPGSAKSIDRFALVLPYNPIRPSPASDEIKHFLEIRKPIRTGTLRVVLVLRGS